MSYGDMKTYRTFEEFEREELRRMDAVGNSVDEMIDTIFGGVGPGVRLRKASLRPSTKTTKNRLDLFQESLQLGRSLLQSAMRRPRRSPSSRSRSASACSFCQSPP